MSFRHNSRERRHWQEWVKTNQDRLIAIGVPREVWEEPMTWWRFVGHGTHPPYENARDVRFRLEDLTETQQKRLYEFLRETLPESERSGIWLELRSRFGRGLANGTATDE